MPRRDPDTVWYTRCPAPTPLGLAWRLGWIEELFERHGIRVSSIRDSADPAVRASHFDHRLDWSFRQGGSVPAIWARARGRETRAIGITSTPEFQAVITLPASGVRRVEDLAGRRVGVPRRRAEIVDFHRATALKGLASALGRARVPVGEVEIVDLQVSEPPLDAPDRPEHFGLRRRLPYGEEIRALASGWVDAIFVKGAEGVTVANTIGAITVADVGFDPDPRVRVNNGTPRPLTVDATFVRARPDLVVELAASVARAGAWAARHPDEALRLVALEIGASKDAVAAAMGPKLGESLGLGLPEDELAALGHFAEFLRDWGFTDASVDVAAWIAPDPLSIALNRDAA
jgi:ABC-type nitrate/sulfonate/bicarbonate transport system substrate-binding protein